LNGGGRSNRLVELSSEARINADLPSQAAGAFGRGIDAGFGTEDLAALIKVLRQGVGPGAPRAARYLNDEVRPSLPVRQRVLSLPKRLRPFLPRDPALAGAVLRILPRAVRRSS